MAAREKPAMRDVHRKTGRFLAWRERPLRRDFQILCVNLQFFAFVLNIDVNMPRAIRHRKFRFARYRNRSEHVSGGRINRSGIVALPFIVKTRFDAGS